MEISIYDVPRLNCSQTYLIVQKRLDMLQHLKKASSTKITQYKAQNSPRIARAN